MKLLPKVLIRWPLSNCCQQKRQMGAVLFFWPMDGWVQFFFFFFLPMDGSVQFFFSFFWSSLAQRSCIVSTLQSESGKWKYNKWGQLLLKIHTFLTPEFSYRVRALAKLAHLQGWMLKATQRYWGHRPLKLILMFNYQVFTDPRKFLPETLWIFPSLMFQLSWNDLNIDISSMAAALVDWFLFAATAFDFVFSTVRHSYQLQWLETPAPVLMYTRQGPRLTPISSGLGNLTS